MTLWSHLSPGQRICLDTSVLIYYFNKHERYFAVCRDIVHAVESEQLSAVISTITEMELLVEPLANAQHRTVRGIEGLLDRLRRLQIMPVDRQLARQAARVRAETKLRGLDALVATTAIETGCRCILGNDREFARRVSGIEYLMLSSLV